MFIKHFATWEKLIVSAWLLFTITGCASTRYIATPSEPPADLGLQGATQVIEVKLHYVIVPDGPGSWVKGARWTEWVVSIRNLTQSDVKIENIRLIDPRGAYVGSQYASVYQLESESEMLAKGYKDFFVGSAGGTAMVQAGAGAAAQAAISTGSMIPIYGLSYLSTVPGFLGPYLEAKDREAIEAEFAKRRLPSPLELSGGASLTGNVFFPLVPQPRALVITYRTAEGETQLKLPLEQLWTPTQTGDQLPKASKAVVEERKPTPSLLVVIKTANVRAEAKGKSKIITTLKKGEKVENLGNSGNWLNVKISSGLTGWVFKDLVREAE